MNIFIFSRQQRQQHVRGGYCLLLLYPDGGEDSAEKAETTMFTSRLSQPD